MPTTQATDPKTDPVGKIVHAQYLSGGDPRLPNYKGNYWIITCECGEVARINPGNWARNKGKVKCKACSGILDREDAIPAMDNLED